MGRKKGKRWPYAFQKEEEEGLPSSPPPPPSIEKERKEEGGIFTTTGGGNKKRILFTRLVNRRLHMIRIAVSAAARCCSSLGLARAHNSSSSTKLEEMRERERPWAF